MTHCNTSEGRRNWEAHAHKKGGLPNFKKKTKKANFLKPKEINNVKFESLVHRRKFLSDTSVIVTHQKGVEIGKPMSIKRGAYKISKEFQKADFLSSNKINNVKFESWAQQ